MLSDKFICHNIEEIGNIELQLFVSEPAKKGF
jgi:hypothetical protein